MLNVIDWLMLILVFGSILYCIAVVIEWFFTEFGDDA